MAERNPAHPEEPGWDPDEIGASLGAFPIPRVHSAYGEGNRYAIGGVYEEPQADLEVYPQSGVVRYASESIHVTLFQQGPPYRERDRILFSGQSETEYRSLTVTDQGAVTLVVNPKSPGEEIPEPPATELPVPPEEPEKPKLKTIAGKLVNDPIEGRTKSGVLMARLSLRPVGEEASTEIFAFGAHARDVLEYFHKDGDYTITGTPKMVGTNGDEREILSLKEMKLGIQDPWTED